MSLVYPECEVKNLTEKKKPSDYKAAMRGISTTREKTSQPEDIPPPPSDWVSNRITKLIGIIFLLLLIGLGIWKGTAILEYIKAHPFGAGLTIFVIVAAIALISVAFWKHRSVGDLGMRYWDTDRKKRKT